MIKDDGIERCIKILLIVLIIAFLVSIVAIILPYILSIFSCKIFCRLISMTTISEYYAILISFLALAFAISIATPYFISKKQMKSVVKNYLETDYKKEVEDQVEAFSRTDAHLSRMIALLLMDKQYYYWAIGWAFRALKRYKNLSGDYQKIYREFHKFLFRDVILQSLDLIAKNPTEDKTKDIFYTDSKNKEIEANRIKIRAIKDYADFLYEINVLYKNQPYVRNMNKYFNNEITDIKAKMPDFCNTVKVFSTDLGKPLFDAVLEISSYRFADKRDDFIKFINKEKLL